MPISWFRLRIADRHSWQDYLFLRAPLHWILHRPLINIQAWALNIIWEPAPLNETSDTHSKLMRTMSLLQLMVLKAKTIASHSMMVHIKI